MFPLQSSQGFEFGPPTTSEDYDQITDHAFFDNNLISFSIGANDEESKKTRNDQASSSRKIVHREVERKRRQEMSSLYASLRSLLPSDRIKGKRSVCDQMQEAAIHIKKTEKNIEELKSKRDSLKRIITNSDAGDGGGDDYVKVNLAGDGVEILISRTIKTSNLGLSRVFAILQERGFDVVSSVSTRMDERFVHNIHIEAREMTNYGLLELQERLMEAIK